MEGLWNLTVLIAVVVFFALLLQGRGASQALKAGFGIIVLGLAAILGLGLLGVVVHIAAGVLGLLVWFAVIALLVSVAARVLRGTA